MRLDARVSDGVNACLDYKLDYKCTRSRRGGDDKARAHIGVRCARCTSSLCGWYCVLLHMSMSFHTALHCFADCRPTIPHLSASVRGSCSVADAVLHLRPAHSILALLEHRGPRIALRGSRLVVRAGHLDTTLRSLITTLRGAGGAPPSLHGKVALVTGASRGLPADDFCLSAMRSMMTLARRVSCIRVNSAQS